MSAAGTRTNEGWRRGGRRGAKKGENRVSTEDEVDGMKKERREKKTGEEERGRGIHMSLPADFISRTRYTPSHLCQKPVWAERDATSSDTPPADPD